MKDARQAGRATREGELPIEESGWLWVSTSASPVPAYERGRMHETDKLTVHKVGPNGEDLGTETFTTDAALRNKWLVEDPQPNANPMPDGYVPPPYDDPMHPDAPQPPEPVEPPPINEIDPPPARSRMQDDHNTRR
jgi:hypothetical protein